LRRLRRNRDSATTSAALAGQAPLHRLHAAGTAAAGDDAEIGARLFQRLRIDVGLGGGGDRSPLPASMLHVACSCGCSRSARFERGRRRGRVRAARQWGQHGGENLCGDVGLKVEGAEVGEGFGQFGGREHRRIRAGGIAHDKSAPGGA